MAGRLLTALLRALSSSVQSLRLMTQAEWGLTWRQPDHLFRVSKSQADRDLLGVKMAAAASSQVRCWGGGFLTPSPVGAVVSLTLI